MWLISLEACLGLGGARGAVMTEPSLALPLWVTEFSFVRGCP